MKNTTSFLFFKFHTSKCQKKFDTSDTCSPCTEIARKQQNQGTHFFGAITTMLYLKLFILFFLPMVVFAQDCMDTKQCSTNDCDDCAATGDLGLPACAPDCFLCYGQRMESMLCNISGVVIFSSNFDNCNAVNNETSSMKLGENCWEFVSESTPIACQSAYHSYLCSSFCGDCRRASPCPNICAQVFDECDQFGLNPSCYSCPDNFQDEIPCMWQIESFLHPPPGNLVCWQSISLSFPQILPVQ